MPEHPRSRAAKRWFQFLATNLLWLGALFGGAGRLDWDRLLHLAGEHWELLFFAMLLFKYAYPSKTDFIPRKIWESMLERTKQAIENPVDVDSVTKSGSGVGLNNVKLRLANLYEGNARIDITRSPARSLRT